MVRFEKEFREEYNRDNFFIISSDKEIKAHLSGYGSLEMGEDEKENIWFRTKMANGIIPSMIRLSDKIQSKGWRKTYQGYNRGGFYLFEFKKEGNA